MRACVRACARVKLYISCVHTMTYMHTHTHTQVELAKEKLEACKSVLMDFAELDSSVNR